MVDLYWQLDDESDPQRADIYLLRSEDGEAHITFTWEMEDFLERHEGEEPFIKFRPSAGVLDAHSGRLKKLKWPRGIVRRAYRSAYGSNTRNAVAAVMSSEELSDFPAEPSQTFTVAEIKAMPAFCGVYFAYNPDGSCHYVGESKNVTSRVSSSREEIGSRRIGVIGCEPHDRKRIEAYFVAMLDPPGNAISTHRMRAGRPKPGQVECTNEVAQEP
jgi:hypothetical protein